MSADKNKDKVLRQDTASNWTANNPLLKSGEWGYEIGTGKLKIGNGTQRWNALAYYETTGPTGPQGPPGDDGADGDDGVFGGNSVRYKFDDDDSMSDPGATFFRFNKAKFNEVGFIAISKSDINSLDITNWLQSLDDSTNTIKGQLRFFKEFNSAFFGTFNLTAVTDNTSWFEVALTYVIGSNDGNDMFSDGDDVVLSFSRTGDKGDTGATGAAGSDGSDGSDGAPGVVPIATAAGTVDAITADYSPNLTLSDKMLCAFVALGANTITNPTFSPDGLTAHTIVKKGGSALVAGDIPAALAVCIIEYNLANTRWELLNPAKVSESDEVYSDVTTNNATPTRHGHLKKLSNVEGEFMDGNGNWTEVLTHGQAYALASGFALP